MKKVTSVFTRRTFGDTFESDTVDGGPVETGSNQRRAADVNLAAVVADEIKKGATLVTWE